MRTFKKFFASVGIMLLLGVFSCEEPTSPDTNYTVTIRGTVTRVSLAPLDSVRVVLDNPPVVLDTTDAKAIDNFVGTFSTSGTEEVTTMLRFRHLNPSKGFRDTAISITYGPTIKTILLDRVIMTSTDSSENQVQPIKSGRAGVITLVGISSSKISIRGAGTNDATSLTFVLKDSLNNPVDEFNKTTVYFELVTKPDTFTVLSVNSAETNNSGQVSVQLTAGQKSGLAQIRAFSVVKRSTDTTQVDTITSPIVSITIAGGLAVESRFTIGSSRYNIPGLVKYDLRQTITAVVGDTFGNPAQSGTKVYFTTNGGIIQPEATTSEDGTLSVQLITGNPVPPNGIATITAQVGTPSGFGKIGSTGANAGLPNVDEEVIVKNLKSKAKKTVSSAKSGMGVKNVNVATGPVFTKSITIMFSGATEITSPDTFVINVGGTTDFSYSVHDLFGNPLTQGTAITVKAEPSDVVELTGDVSRNLPDTKDVQFTQFNVSLKDKRTANLSQSVPMKLTIDVISENGNLSKTISGLLFGTGGVAVDSSIVSRIVLVDPKADTMAVTATAGSNRKDIQFRAINTFGLPAKNVPITFSLKKSVNGGEYVTPSTGITDNQGLVTATLVSGVRTGEVQVIASATRDSVTFINSDPKIINFFFPAGILLASQIEFINITRSSIDIAGVGGVENSQIFYQVKDSLGFPIDKNRRVLALYDLQFDPASSAGGGTPPAIIPASDSTDDNGRLTARIVSGTQAGVVTVRVVVNLPNRPPVVSTPVKISIHAGFADQGHFTLRTNHFVYCSDVTFTASVGDTFSNPIKAGTAVYFSSQASRMSTGAVTDAAGRVSATLFAYDNPQPDDGERGYPAYSKTPTYDTTAYPAIGGRKGYHWVWAQTRGRWGDVKDSLLVVQAVPPILISGVPPIDSLVPLYSATKATPTINITVTDARGNPLPDGSTISVDIIPPPDPPEGFAVYASGNVPQTLPNASYARFPGYGITNFEFSITDGSTISMTGLTLTARIIVNTPCGWSLVRGFKVNIE